MRTNELSISTEGIFLRLEPKNLRNNLSSVKLIISSIITKLGGEVSDEMIKDYEDEINMVLSLIESYTEESDITTELTINDNGKITYNVQGTISLNVIELFGMLNKIAE